jgi:leucyl-tRNA synthetase
VWWCDELGTVLANEEVIDGLSEVGNHPCERRPLRQWMLKITQYAERLLDGLEGLDWPESVKAMQRAWIGRSEGAEVEFRVDGTDKTFGIFTTRPDTLFGVTYMVLAPEHPLVDRIVADDTRDVLEAYRRTASAKSDLDRTDLNKDKSGVFTGAFAVNPVFADDDPRARVPIWVADYVLMSYGTGAIMSVPGSDDRDFDFAIAHDLPIWRVVAPVAGLERPDDPKEAEKCGFRRQAERGGETLECFVGDGRAVNCRSSVDDFSIDGQPKGKAISNTIAWLEKRGIGTGKTNYKLRDWLFSRQRYWGEPFPVLHLADGSHTIVPDDALPVMPPEMTDYAPSGSMEPPLGKATDWVATTDPTTGAPARRETNTMPQWAGSCWYYLRFCDPHNESAAFAAEAEQYWMPVDLYVGGAEHAVLHLLYARFWHKVLFDAGLVRTEEPFQKLFNQGMVQSFAYKTTRGATIAIDLAEERDGQFFHTETGEELERIVAKMSKSLKNVQSPDTIVDEWGADTMRLYEMFMGPLETSTPWNPDDLPGVHRFLHRSWRLVVPNPVVPDGEDGGSDEDTITCHDWLNADRNVEPTLEKALHKAIAKVTDDLAGMRFNTAVSAMMVFVNEATKAGETLTRSQAERFVLMLAPFAPHIGEELWARLGHDKTLTYEPWPSFDKGLLLDDEVELAVQIQGKVRTRIVVPADADKAVILVRARSAVSEFLDGAQVVKEIVVPGRLVNFVTR